MYGLSFFFFYPTIAAAILFEELERKLWEKSRKMYIKGRNKKTTLKENEHDQKEELLIT